MLHYVNVKVADVAHSGAFYDAILGPMGWRRQSESAKAIGWGFAKPHFFISPDGDGPKPGFGVVSFPAKSIPAVKAAYEAGLRAGGESVAEPGAKPAAGAGTYSARLTDPDGYTVELIVAP